MTAPPLTPPPRPVVTPGECEAQRDKAKCGQPARLFPSSWLCQEHQPGAPPPQPPAPTD